MDGSIFLLKALKAMIEVAGLSFIGQGLVGFFSGAQREQNFVYVLFKIITKPVSTLTRRLAPRFIPDRRISILSFGLLLFCWVATILVMASLIRADAAGG